MLRHIVYVPDPRVSFVMIFSETDFQLWKSTAEFPVLHPYQSSANKIIREQKDTKKPPSGEEKQDVAKATNGENPPANLAGPGKLANKPLQTTTTRVHKISRRIAFEQGLWHMELEDGNGNGNGNEPGQSRPGDKINDARGDKNATERDTNTNKPVIDGIRSPAGSHRASSLDPIPEENSVFKPSNYPQRKVVRRFIIKRFINENRRTPIHRERGMHSVQ
ncbi:hypothetical protein N7533_003365 [Penicillium manginii]|uniref:uncharacterized protein n=1 Tax=Penicillium manginii TaxID=203109 RepID=UPI0025483DC5|nr:uncharacterized protein N7533_008423 [Penicillium manginii]XP_056962703.1 uncharacterized protein N7533_003365 [Penicillium manginii]KAJ5743553.1 hypothetical protein N7533_008423 [Penicillium manginii]KAJ5761326.1 hypothetical protein N7533_003365 [Penicillium manginii]